VNKLLPLLLCLLLAGCGTASAPARIPSPAPAPTASPTPVAPSSGGEDGYESVSLKGLRDEQKIQECPDTDLAAPPAKEGMVQTALECLGGTKRVNLAGLERKPTLINTWASWCGPCQDEMKALAEVYAAHRTRVNFYGIITAEPYLQGALLFASASKATYPQMIDNDSVLRTKMQIIGLPTTVILDADGRIVFRHSGPLTKGEFLDALAQAGDR